MATRTKTTSVDRAANWILSQSWSALAVAAAIAVGASIAVGSYAPANLIGTTLVGMDDISSRQELTAAATGLGPVSDKLELAKATGLSGILKTELVGDNCEFEPWNCVESTSEPTPQPQPSQDPGSGGCTPGGEGCSCRAADPRCDDGLTCSNNTCVVDCSIGSNFNNPACVGGGAPNSPKPSPEERGITCYRCEKNACVESIVLSNTCPTGSSPTGCDDFCVQPLPGVTDLPSPSAAAPTESPSAAPSNVACCPLGATPDLNGFCPDGNPADTSYCNGGNPAPVGGAPSPSTQPSTAPTANTVGQDCSYDTDCGDPAAGYRCGGLPGNKKCLYEAPSTPNPGGSCQTDSDCPEGNDEYEYKCLSVSGGASSCQPVACEENGGSTGFRLLQLLANEIFIQVHAQGTGGLPRSQPCYRALLARIANGSLQCDPADAAACAQDGGKGCFKDPSNGSKPECFTFSNTNNPCINPDGTSMSCPNGMTCSACFGGCVKVSDFCNEQQCASTGGVCSHITLSCVPSGNASCTELCGRAGLSCVGSGETAQCIQDRCTGRAACPSGQTCDKATGACSGGNFAPVEDACALFDAGCPTGYECKNVDSGDGINKKAECQKVGDPAVKVAFDPCDKSIPTNRDCPPETICVNIGGFAECKLPPNSACDSYEVTNSVANDCVDGATCKRNASSGIGQCTANFGTSSSNKCDATKACPAGMACAADGLCKINRSECSTDADCKASGLGLKVCRQDTVNNVKRCGYPDTNGDNRPDIDACYLVDILNDSKRFGLSTSEILEVSVLLQGQKCERAGTTTFTVNPAGLPGLQNVNGRYLFPVPGSLSGVAGSGATVPGGGSTNGGVLTNLCSTATACAKTGEIAFKKSGTTGAAEVCECRFPTIADYVPGLPGPTRLSMCSNDRPIRRTASVGAGSDGGFTGSADNVGDLNSGQQGVAGARETLDLPCFAAEYHYVNGVLTPKASYVFCGEDTTDVTGCARITTDGAHGYPTAQYVGGATCNPSKPKACKVDMEAIKAAAVPEGSACPNPPTFSRGATSEVKYIGPSYEQDHLVFQATLAANVKCTFEISNGCPGAGKTVLITLADFEKPDAYSKSAGTFGSNIVKGDDGATYTYGRGGLQPLGAYCGGSGGDTGTPGRTPTPTPAVDSSKLPLCPDATYSSSLAQCKYPIHPWYNLTSTTYPYATSDRLYAIFGGPKEFVAASCWTIREYTPAQSNSQWGANLVAADTVTEGGRPGFLTRVWNWFLGVLGFDSPTTMNDPVVYTTASTSDLLKAGVSQACMTGTKIRKGAADPNAPGGGVRYTCECIPCLCNDSCPGGKNYAGNVDSVSAAALSEGVEGQAAPQPPVLPGRRYYAVPTCSGSGPSPLNPNYTPPSPTPTTSSSPRPSASASPATCGSSCPSGQCKEIAGYGPFCVSQNSCATAPSPCGAGKYMCVTDEGQWSCTTAALRPAGATCIVCDGSTPLPTSSATPRPSTSPSVSASPTATPGPTAPSGVSTFSIALPTALAVGTPVDMTVCAKDKNGATVPSYRGTVIKFIAEDTPISSLPNLPRYTFTAADNGCHTFTGGLTLAFPGESTVVVMDVDYSDSVYGVKVVNTSGATATPTSGATPRPSASASPTPTATPNCSFEPAHPFCVGMGGSPSPSPSGLVCPQDLKLCPDGSYVGRTRPACQFAACPTPGNSNTNSVACSAEAKLCPDGSVVSRVKPNCEFAACQKVLGDVNGDGRITIVDVVMITDFLSGKPGVTLSSEQFLLADVTCDQLLNLADVAKIANFIVTGTDGASRTLTCGPTR